MFWKRRDPPLTPEKAAEIVQAAEALEERYRLINELAQTIHAEHLRAIEGMTPGERALLREIRASRYGTWSFSYQQAMREICEAEAVRIIKDREAVE